VQDQFSQSPLAPGKKEKGKEKIAITPMQERSEAGSVRNKEEVGPLQPEMASKEPLPLQEAYERTKMGR